MSEIRLSKKGVLLAISAMLLSVGMVLPAHAAGPDPHVFGHGRASNYFCAFITTSGTANISFEAKEKDGVWSGSYNVTDASSGQSLSSGTFGFGTLNGDTFVLNNEVGGSGMGCNGGGRWGIGGTCGDEVAIDYVSLYDGGTFISDVNC